VRVPAAFCGVFGHKPSLGIIPTFGYLDEPTGGRTESDNNTFGPIARDAPDLELLLSVLAGPGPADSVAWRLELPPADVTSLRELRVAAWIDEPALVGDSAMTAVLHAAVDAIEAAGAHVDRTAKPAIDVEHMWRLGALLIGAAVDVHPTDVGPLGISHHDWLRVDRERARLRAAWAELFEQFDVVVCPATIVPAFEHLQDGRWDTRMVPVDGGLRRYVEMEGWPSLVGAAYLPSTATPVGLTPAGLPVGAQIVAPYLRDRLSIKVAELVADTTGRVGRPPIVRSP
jgi:amidase